LCGSSFDSNIKRQILALQGLGAMSKSFRFVMRFLGAGSLVFLMSTSLTAAGTSAPLGSFTGSLMFGMSPAQAATALGVPLTYVRGRGGDELFLAIPNVKGSALSIRSDGLYLQFRRGRLTGWRGDWGTAKPFVIGW
jgi:hypothetical protein